MYNMNKKIILLAIASVLTSIPMFGQHFRDSKYYNQNTGRLDYNKGTSYYCPWGYAGLRIGPSFSSFSSDYSMYDSAGGQTGLNLTAVTGFKLTGSTPLYLESGLEYTEKGAKDGSGRNKIEYNVNYLEIPLVLKYIYNVDDDISIQPFAGGYFAYGVGGKIKDYSTRESWAAFGKDKPGLPRFDRWDSGLKFGCGFGYDVFYADVNVEIGLANISNDSFDKTSNLAFSVNFGVNF